MDQTEVKFILTDIEGTTTSVSFVYDVLFLYFRENIAKLKDMIHLPEVFEAFEETIILAKISEDINLAETDEIIATLLRWSLEDKKITPLKIVQGILWQEAYLSGEIKGHVYPDVPVALKRWADQGISLGVFSSGSVTAQKLIFTYSEFGDLSTFFTHYYDTLTGGKRDTETYDKISENLGINPANILFLSDITEELQAAEKSGYQTIQLLRPGTLAHWHKTACDFNEISFD